MPVFQAVHSVSSCIMCSRKPDFWKADTTTCYHTRTTWAFTTAGRNQTWINFFHFSLLHKRVDVTPVVFAEWWWEWCRRQSVKCSVTALPLETSTAQRRGRELKSTSENTSPYPELNRWSSGSPSSNSASVFKRATFYSNYVTVQHILWQRHSSSTALLTDHMKDTTHAACPTYCFKRFMRHTCNPCAHAC